MVISCLSNLVDMILGLNMFSYTSWKPQEGSAVLGGHNLNFIARMTILPKTHAATKQSHAKLISRKKQENLHLNG